MRRWLEPMTSWLLGALPMAPPHPRSGGTQGVGVVPGCDPSLQEERSALNGG